MTESETMAAEGDPRPGRTRARRPTELTRGDWIEAGKSVYRRLTEDHLALVAAGVAFYGMLALFPMIGALTSIYGLAADPTDVTQHLNALESIAPESAYDIIANQAQKVASASSNALSAGAIGAALFAVWSSRAGVNALIKGLHIAYRQDNERSLVKTLAVSYALTLAILLIAAVAVGVMVAGPAALSLFAPESFAALVAYWIRFPIGLAAILFGVGLLYRYGPSRTSPRIAWITPGAVFASLCWIAGSAGFSWYVANFGSYNETYGSLGAVIGLLMWIFLSAFVVLLGAEVNAALEERTALDTNVDGLQGSETQQDAAAASPR